MTTTGYPLPTKPEVRERLKAANFDPVILDPGLEQWFAGGYCFTLKDGQTPSISRLKYTDDDLPLDLTLRFASILGIYQTPPPGMVLVPAEAVANAVRSLLDAADLAQGKRPMSADLWRSHAAALTPIHEPGAPSKGDGD